MRVPLALAAGLVLAAPALAAPAPALPVEGCQAVAPQNLCFFDCPGAGHVVVVSFGGAGQSAKARCGDGPASQAGCGEPFACAGVGAYTGPPAQGTCFADEATYLYACTFVPAG